MKKYLKIFVIFLFSLLIFGLSKTVQANSIHKMSMDIYIDNNGDATVTEVWDCYTSQGTEVYHPYYNLGNSKIQNLKVSERRTQYQTLSSWNTKDSLSSKANKCGINKITNGVEICWGISSYGSHQYTVQYTITNFVSELTDSQMIYWTLIPYDFSNSIGSVDIKIHAGFGIKDTVDVWGYGNYGGLAYVNNDAIYMKSDGMLDTDEYMTILVKFPLDTFNCSNELDYDFDHFFKMAEEGSTKYNKKNESVLSGIMAAVIFIFNGFCTFLPFCIIAKVAITKKAGFKYGEAGKKIPKKVDYYRDVPCNGDIFRSYYIAYQYNLVKNKTDILGSIILKWIKEGIIRTENREGGKIFKRENIVIILGNEINRNFKNDKETQLFKMMYEASEDGILENKEFERWCKKSYEKILGWFDQILIEQRDLLVNEGLITCEDRGWLFGKKHMATQKLKDEAIKIAGLRRYLLEYTLIKNREAIEVQLFEDYLIYAQMLGIADKVQKQFKELYPDIIEQTNYGSYDSLVYIHLCTSRGISSANSARAAAESYNSGGGGFSSGGGGGGSFGGGGGGRRLPIIIKDN